MPSGAPAPFYSREYWDLRFQKETTPFDWLHPANVLDKQVTEAIAKYEANGIKPKILHIGCGTSLLSLQLRGLVADPEQIWNIDFSKNAVELGRRWEKELADRGVWGNVNGKESLGTIQQVLKEIEAGISPALTEPASSLSVRNRNVPPEPQNCPESASRKGMMHWQAVDLLSFPSLMSALEPNSFDVIIEKSCSDAIACGDDIEVETLDKQTSIISLHKSYQIRGPSPTSEHGDIESNASRSRSPPPDRKPAFIHPVNLLALHLAQVAKPASLWIMLTFSEDRVPFNPSPFRKPVRVTDPLPSPVLYWTPILKKPVVTAESQAQASEKDDGAPVYRPEVYHYIMVLERTLEAVGATSNTVALIGP